MYFLFRDESVKSRNVSEQNLANTPVTVTVTDTFYTDESKDKIISKKVMKTDSNGNLSFNYTFNKENFFDVDLAINDKSGKKQATGFLIRPRAAAGLKLTIASAISAFGLGILASDFVRRRIKRSQ